MPRLAERVASLVLSTFHLLPQKSKPRTYPDGSREWIPMSGIVLACDADTELESLTCVVLATGSKCLPISAIPKCNGMVLHDSHAEVLALRALSCFFLDEVHAVLHECDVQYVSPFVSFRLREPCQPHKILGSHQPFEIRRNVSIWMFSTEAPCGDASMEVLMAERKGDVEPWDRKTDNKEVLQGRGYFSALGEVRRKPSRRDAEATMSKSCTDKLTVKQVTSVLSFPANLIIASTENAYLSSLVVPSSKYSEEGFRRAFGRTGRMASMPVWQLPPDFQFHPFKTETLPSDFEPFPFAKVDTAQQPAKAGNVSAIFIRNLREISIDLNETILGGVRQGHRPFADDPKKTSVVCRLRLWELVRSLVDLIQDNEKIPVEDRKELLCTRASMTYERFKGSDLNAHRVAAKDIVTQTLGKWPKNSGDEGWSLQYLANEDMKLTHE